MAMSQHGLAAQVGEKSDALVEQIKAILKGQGPLLQGAVIGDLFALWLWGHPSEMREEMGKVVLDLTFALLDHYIEHPPVVVDVEREVH